MAKKIRFPLEMADGVLVRTLEELKENFYLPQVLMYLENGKLNTWLRDRYEDELADALEVLDADVPDLPVKICDLFEVELNMTDVEDMEKIQERNRKIERLKEYVDEDKYIGAIDQMAFDQDELYDLLDEGKTTIYLCGESFSIPLGKKGIEYIGVNNPVVKIASKTIVDWDEKQISLIGISFDEEYLSLFKSNRVQSYELKEVPVNTILEETSIVLAMDNGTQKTINSIGKNVLDSNDRYVVTWNGHVDKPVCVLDLEVRQIICAIIPPSFSWYCDREACKEVGVEPWEHATSCRLINIDLFDNVKELKLCGDWIIWDAQSLNVQTGELIKFNMTKDHPGQAKQVDGFSICDDRIVYRVAEYAKSGSRNTEDWGYNFYICDHNWKNSRQIYSLRNQKMGTGLFVRDFVIEDGQVRIKIKTGLGVGGGNRYTLAFNLAEECEKSKRKITVKYVAENGMTGDYYRW